MTQKEINHEINFSLIDGPRNIYEVVEEISYENRVDSMLVGSIVEKMVSQGWIDRSDSTISLRFPYIVD